MRRREEVRAAGRAAQSTSLLAGRNISDGEGNTHRFSDTLSGSDGSNSRTNLCLMAIAAFHEICCPLEDGSVPTLGGNGQTGEPSGSTTTAMELPTKHPA